MKRAVHFGVLIFMAAAVFALPVRGQYAPPSWSQPTADRPALDVPYVPTPPDVIAAMMDMAGVNSADVLYDLGCGDGRIVVTAARERNVRKAVGFDLDPKRIRESVMNARKAGVAERASFQQKDLFDVDLSEATVLSLYLLPTVNLKLRPKLFRELKPGTRVVSHDFDMAEWQPDRTAHLGPHTVHSWVVPVNAGGSWKWSLADGEQSHSYELQLQQRFQKVEQAHLFVDGKEQPVSDVTVEGDKLSFTTEGVMDGKKQSLRFSGRVQGNSLHGSVTASNRPDGSRKWTAERASAPVLPLDRAVTQEVRL